MSGVAQELAWLPETTRRLLAVHVSDGRGRCRGCTTPGTGMPGQLLRDAAHAESRSSARVGTTGAAASAAAAT
ncbi:MAG TPA: hypothetical protein VM785_10820, partial [Gaiellales bacterium]|nr:hypothetical protein [Gaiellales bacterium]